MYLKLLNSAKICSKRGGGGEGGGGGGFVLGVEQLQSTLHCGKFFCFNYKCISKVVICFESVM